MERVLGGMAAVAVGDPVVTVVVEEVIIVMATELEDMEVLVTGLEAEVDQEEAEADQEEAEVTVEEVVDQEVVVVTEVEDTVKLTKSPEMLPAVCPPSVSARAGTPYKSQYSPPVSSSMSAVHPHRTVISEDHAKFGSPPPQPELVFCSL